MIGLSQERRYKRKVVAENGSEYIYQKAERPRAFQKT